RAARRSDRKAPRFQPRRLSPRFGQRWLDARGEFLSELRADSGTLRLVRALGGQRRQARVYVRVRRSLYVGLDDVSRLVPRAAKLRQRGCAVGVLSRGVEFAVPR